MTVGKRLSNIQDSITALCEYIFLKAAAVTSPPIGNQLEREERGRFSHYELAYNPSADVWPPQRGVVWTIQVIWFDLKDITYSSVQVIHGYMHTLET